MKNISAKEFIDVISDIIVNPERKFCFILGAGASRNSNIQTGMEFAIKWFQEIKERLTFPKFQQWIEDCQIDENNPGSKYSDIYLKRFENDKQSAFDFLYQAMKDANPSIGYAILSQILANTRNNVVITTNFDSLIEQSLYYYTSKKPLVCGHEDLSNYAKPSSDRPLIIKIHRDLFYNPFSEPGQINTLADNWKKPLHKVFNQYIPIVLGYAGNDGSLMDYLMQIDLPDKIFWCYRRNSFPEKKIIDLLAKQSDSTLVEIAGFDEIMYQLMEVFKLDSLEGIIKKRFDLDVNKLTLQYTEISNRLGVESLVADTTDMVNYMLQSKGEPASVYLYINLFVSEKLDKLSFIQKALEKFPNAPLLLILKAQELLKKSKHEEAEQTFNLAIEYGSEYPLVLNEYANYLALYKKDIYRADKFFSKSIVQMPDEYTFLLNYANFLFSNNLDANLCEVLYKNAIKYSPDSYTPNFYYALFLLKTRKEKENGVAYLMKVLQNDHLLVQHKIYICTQLVFFEKDIDIALKVYATISMEEKNELEMEGLFYIMRDYQAIESNLLSKLEKSPLNPVYLIKIANYYLKIKNDLKTASEFYQRIPVAIPDDVIKQVSTEMASLLCTIDKNYSEAIRILNLEIIDFERDHITLGIIYKNHLDDFEKASSSYQHYINTRPLKEPFFEEFTILANLADLHFYYDKFEEAIAFLEKAISVTCLLDNILCLWFYRFMYQPSYRMDALSAIFHLLDSGVRNPRWTFKYNIEKLETKNHPDISLIKKLGSRIVEYKDNLGWYQLDQD